ncbi:hypothetical protein [Enemella evansiae]|uniref:hypothetical protein n=1 Tax=Enemella evansiae TaxID=2016499 RepID=UPI00105E5756|nr:hypothetical protein [Enemella evansiae]TDO93327.1 hypothetical protein C8D81_1110 [Enemella evansiae]
MVARRSAALLSVLAFALVGCNTSSAGGQPGETSTGTPGPATSASATPSASPTPSQEELTKQAQAAYQIAFDEFERLSREGGADQPSAKMLEVEDPGYLDLDMAFLRDQKAVGYRVEGAPATTKSRSVPSAEKSGSDRRLTLQVCEDRRGSSAVYPNGATERNRLWQGFVYGKLVNGRVKLVDIETSEVQQCDW